jgi:excinuclease ABC subunit C
MAPEELRQIILNLPSKPGVYKYFDSSKQILYIGKAKNLKKRVSSYFTKTHQENHKTTVLVSKISHVEFTVVETEYDALLLENSLIKEFKPRYNINLKDDKSYPYIRITNERFPKVYAMRNPVKDGSEYFGPYSSVSMMHLVLDLIKKLYPIRNCQYNLSEKNIKAGKFRLCLEYHIGNCKGPCTGLQSEEDYMQNIRQIKYLLKGNLNEVYQLLKSQMNEAAANLQFEEAQRLKEKLDELKKFQSKSTVVKPSLGDLEVLTITTDELRGYVNYMTVSNGMVIRTGNMMIKKILDEKPEELILSALAEVRNKNPFQADEILMNIAPGIQDKSLKITVPKVGDKKKLVELSLKNAIYYKREKVMLSEKADPSLKFERILERMKTDLRLSEKPVHIECFDNSNLQGTHPVAACVVFKNTKPSKKDYRHFNIKTVIGPNDFDSMTEVVYRRYKRLTEEGESLPQLIVIDGGKGQLSASVKALKELNLYGKIAIIGIAKRLEEIYFPEDSFPLHLDKTSETLKIIQQLRDEAHRFGITHHKQKRNKSTLQTELNQIPGVGDKTAQKLLTYFQSVKKIKNLSVSTLQEIVPLKTAQKIYDYFHQS